MATTSSQISYAGVYRLIYGSVWPFSPSSELLPSSALPLVPDILGTIQSRKIQTLVHDSIAQMDQSSFPSVTRQRAFETLCHGNFGSFFEVQTLRTSREPPCNTKPTEFVTTQRSEHIHSGSSITMSNRSPSSTTIYHHLFFRVVRLFLRNGLDVFALCFGSSEPDDAGPTAS